MPIKFSDFKKVKKHGQHSAKASLPDWNKYKDFVLGPVNPNHFNERAQCIEVLNANMDKLDEDDGTLKIGFKLN